MVRICCWKKPGATGRRVGRLPPIDWHRGRPAWSLFPSKPSSPGGSHREHLPQRSARRRDQQRQSPKRDGRPLLSSDVVCGGKDAGSASEGERPEMRPRRKKRPRFLCHLQGGESHRLHPLPRTAKPTKAAPASTLTSSIASSRASRSKPLFLEPRMESESTRMHTNRICRVGWCLSFLLPFTSIPDKFAVRSNCSWAWCVWWWCVSWWIWRSQRRDRWARSS